MTLADFQDRVHSVLLPAAAMQGDPIGTQIASSACEVSRVFTCMEITDAVVDEAIKASCDTIVTFHPLIYSPLKALAGQDRVARLVARLVRSEISVVCVHTSFDAFPQGTNMIFAQKLGLSQTHPLQPAEAHDSPLGVYGMGIVGYCNLEFHELLERVSTVCSSPVRFSNPATSQITKVAIVAGSGMSFYQRAVDSGADVFITADVKYHDFHAATSTIGIIDPGHYEMEQFVPQGILSSLSDVCTGCELIASTVRTSPVEYYVPQTLQRH
ncbi:MAG: Nif3-like dinuclear metal center hexameric protein [Ignavibacteria bacterium]|nr:Nif3-like dinuclear metal center hexameric protein [Ignavibacteria bacterium]